ncbi:hypothetical protein MWU75_18080 [Ornithinimicrobium sp. F0845]|uniref:hypothetical protein n=1 Tax=Ornithinimicrobium sp. F0845 TaxID=2926412 RepID=UPI001FF1ACF1|nr:hypothetical protein [Ornithinimicrobium sp. F0845]MCK0114055.1 hypothetical protein [Ornithinimicrobium sp. F0845]
MVHHTTAPPRPLPEPPAARRRPGGGSLVDHTVALQRAAGNRAVSRLVGGQPLSLQRLNGAVPTNFTVTNAVANSAGLTISTQKAWQSSTNVAADLADVEMREHIVFNHAPTTDMPGYAAVVHMVPNMQLAGNILTKVAGAMQGLGGTDDHAGAGFGLYFTAPGGQANLSRGTWTLVGTQVYQYRDRGAGGPWLPLHAAGGPFTITRSMAIDSASHTYQLTFTKTGPGVNVTAGPTVIPLTMDEAISDIAVARPDQTQLWQDLDQEITVTQEHEYHHVSGENLTHNGVPVPVEYVITRPWTTNPQSPNRAMFAPYETLVPAEYNPLIANIRSGLVDLVQTHVAGLAQPPQRLVMIMTKATGGVRQQALFTQGGPGAGPTLRIVFRYGKFGAVDQTARDTSQAGSESIRGHRTTSKTARWQKATVIHEMGHLLHAFNDMGSFQAATVDANVAAAAPLADQPHLFTIAAVNTQILAALNARNYPARWQYAQANPAEVVAEVWTAVMHRRKVPRGLAAVYLAYGGAQNALIIDRLRRRFPHNQLPALATPLDALPHI